MASCSAEGLLCLGSNSEILISDLLTRETLTIGLANEQTQDGVPSTMSCSLDMGNVCICEAASKSQYPVS